MMYTLQHEVIPFTFAIVAVLLLQHGVSGLQVYPSPESLPTSVPVECRDTLSANISCSPRLIRANELLYGAVFNETFLNEYCNETCTQSINDWGSKVNQTCGSANISFGPDIANISGNDISEPLLWAHKFACLTEKKNDTKPNNCTCNDDFCLPKVANGSAQGCDDCNLKYIAGLLDYKHNSGRVNESDFNSLLASCGANPTDYPHATPTPDPMPPYPTNIPGISCDNYGIKHTVTPCDTCQSIADAYFVATDRFLYQNGLDFNCESLRIGSEVCITDCCDLQTVQSNETCRDILRGKSFTMTELLAWNPVIHRDCGNIGALVGRSICVSPPDGSGAYNVNVTVSWTASWTLGGSWEAVETAASDAPALLAKPVWPVAATMTLGL